MTTADVRITGLANSQSEINMQGDTKFRFKLLPQPDSTWENAFQEAYSATKDNMWRSAEIVGSELVISCHHSQLENEYVPKLNRAIDQANETSKKIAEAFAADMAKRRAKEATVEAEKEKILKGINDKFK